VFTVVQLIDIAYGMAAQDRMTAELGGSWEPLMRSLHDVTASAAP
jgi:hypothetical protein